MKKVIKKIWKETKNEWVISSPSFGKRPKSSTVPNPKGGGRGNVQDFRLVKREYVKKFGNTFGSKITIISYSKNGTSSENIKYKGGATAQNWDSNDNHRSITETFVDGFIPMQLNKILDKGGLCIDADYYGGKNCEVFNYYNPYLTPTPIPQFIDGEKVFDGDYVCLQFTPGESDIMSFYTISWNLAGILDFYENTNLAEKIQVQYKYEFETSYSDSSLRSISSECSYTTLFEPVPVQIRICLTDDDGRRLNDQGNVTDAEHEILWFYSNPSIVTETQGDGVINSTITTECAESLCLDYDQFSSDNEIPTPTPTPYFGKEAYSLSVDQVTHDDATFTFKVNEALYGGDAKRGFNIVIGKTDHGRTTDMTRTNLNKWEYLINEPHREGFCWYFLTEDAQDKLDDFLTTSVFVASQQAWHNPVNIVGQEFTFKLSDIKESNYFGQESHFTSDSSDDQDCSSELKEQLEKNTTYYARIELSDGGWISIHDTEYVSTNVVSFQLPEEPTPTPTPLTINHLEWRWHTINGEETLQVKNLLQPSHSNFSAMDTSMWTTVYGFCCDPAIYDLSHAQWPSASVSGSYLEVFSNPLNKIQGFEGMLFTLGSVETDSVRGDYMTINVETFGSNMRWSDDASPQTNELFVYVGNINNEDAANQKSGAWPTIIKIPTPTPTPTPELLKFHHHVADGSGFTYPYTDTQLRYVLGKSVSYSTQYPVTNLRSEMVLQDGNGGYIPSVYSDVTLSAYEGHETDFLYWEVEELNGGLYEGDYAIVKRDNLLSTTLSADGDNIWKLNLVFSRDGYETRTFPLWIIIVSN